MKPSFDEIFIGTAINMSKRSHCVKAHVGAVLVKEGRIVSTGYNGPPEGDVNCDETYPKQGCKRDRYGGCLYALHAEANAIFYAAKQKVSIDGTSLYVTLSPCLACARLIYIARIGKVVYKDSYADYKNSIKQKNEKTYIEEGLEFLERFGVEVVHYTVN